MPVPHTRTPGTPPDDRVLALIYKRFNPTKMLPLKKCPWLIQDIKNAGGTVGEDYDLDASVGSIITTLLEDSTASYEHQAKWHKAVRTLLGILDLDFLSAEREEFVDMMGLDDFDTAKDTVLEELE